MSRVILHSDCNAFYASVECVLNPALQNKAVAVCGNAETRHGVILAKSEQAKAFGVKTGEAIWQAKEKCPQLITVNARFEAYLSFSEKVRQIYLDYTDRVEPFGLDEAWLDVTGSRCLFGSGQAIAEEIRQRVKKEVGITVSIGVSYNKIFAKLGSDYQKPDAVTVISKENYRSLLWPLPANELLYVGKATQKKLAQLGIYTIGDIAACRRDTLRQNLGKLGGLFYSFANGLDTSPVALYSDNPPPKSIGNSITAVRDLKTLSDAKIIFHILAGSVCRRMREQSLRCQTVCISIRDHTLASFTRQIKLSAPTSITKDILNAALTLFRQNYNGKHSIRSLGLSVCDFTAYKEGVQLSFFADNETARIRLENLDSTVDRLKQRFGGCIVVPALLLTDKNLSGFDPKDKNLVHSVGFRRI